MNRCNVDFGGVAVLLIGGFCQLPPVKQKTIFSSLTPTDVRLEFKLHKLAEIVRQSSDPHFAQLLNRLLEGKHNQEDIDDIKALTNTDTSNWPADHTKLYITNALVNNENDGCLKKLKDKGETVFTIYSKDSTTDRHTGVHKINIDDNLPMSYTGSLAKHLKICVGAKVMLAINMDIGDRPLNGSIGRVMYMNDVATNQVAKGIIYVKVDDENAGNNYKDNRLRGVFKQCVPISVSTNRSSFERGKS